MSALKSLTDRERWNQAVATRIKSYGRPHDIEIKQRDDQRESSKETAMSDTSTISWKEAYEKALRETDKQKLGELVLSAEAAIFRRYQELAPSSNHHEERRSMNAASEQLLSLKVNRLGWPPVQ
jgi:hypothetical protein